MIATREKDRERSETPPRRGFAVKNPTNTSPSHSGLQDVAEISRRMYEKIKGAAGTNGCRLGVVGARGLPKT